MAGYTDQELLDAGFNPALIPIIRRESRGRSVGWEGLPGSKDYSPGGTDLSGYPLKDTGFPAWPGKMGPEGNSTAAGVAQIVGSVWDPIARKLGVTGFSLPDQAKVANELYRQSGKTPWAASAPGYRGGGSPDIAAGTRPGERSVGGGLYLGEIGRTDPFLNALISGVIARRGQAQAEPEKPSSGILSELFKQFVSPAEAAEKPTDLHPPEQFIEPPAAPPPAADIISTQKPLEGVPAQGSAVGAKMPATAASPIPVPAPAPAVAPQQPPQPAAPPATVPPIINNALRGAATTPMVGPAMELLRQRLQPPQITRQPAPPADAQAFNPGRTLLTQMAEQFGAPSQESVEAQRPQYAEQAEYVATQQQPSEPIIAGNPLRGEPLTGRIPRMAEIVAGGMAGPVPGGAFGAGPRMRLPRGVRQPAERIEPTFTPSPEAQEEIDRLRSQERIAETRGREQDIEAGQAPREPPANAPGPDLVPPEGVKATAGKLDDALYSTLKNNEADMVQARQFVESLPPEWLTPEFSERHYTEAESRLINPRARLSPDVAEAERAMQEMDHDIYRIATDLRTKHPELAEEFPDLLTAEQGYVHRKVIGQNIVGERLDPGIERDVIGVGGRNLGKRASGLERRTQNFVAEDAAGNRTWSQKRLGEPGAPTRYGEKFVVGNKEMMARRPTTQEIERNTPRRYIKNRIANTVDNWLRLKRIQRNIALSDEWKPRLEQAGLWSPETNVIPARRVPVDIPQMRGHAEPWIAHTLNDFYARSADDFAGFLAKANRFLIGTMFALPFRHQLNVATHYTVGRGFDWARHNPQLIRATRAVTEQNQDYIRLLRAGAGLQYANTLNQNFYKVMLEKLFHDQIHDPGWEEGVAKHLGVKISDLVKAEYEWSRKALWKVNDIFLVGRIMELEGKGLPTAEAIRRAEQEIPNYRIPAQVAGNRALATALKSPAFIAFGRYTYGKYRAIAETVKNMIGPIAKGEEGRRMEAIGQAVVMAMLGTIGYKVANAGLQTAMQKMGYEGKPMEFVRGGPLGMMEAAGDIAQSAAHYLVGLDPGERDLAGWMSTLISPAPLTETLARVASPFTSKPIWDPGADLLGKTIQAGEAAASSIFPGQIAIDAMRRGPLAAFGPSFGVKQEFQPPSGRVQKMLRGVARSHERKSPLDQFIRRQLQ